MVRRLMKDLRTHSLVSARQPPGSNLMRAMSIYHLGVSQASMRRKTTRLIRFSGSSSLGRTRRMRLCRYGKVTRS